jgi:Ca2+-binding EF-hand superfamily protein
VILISLIDRYDLNDDGKLAYGEFLKAFSQDRGEMRRLLRINGIAYREEDFDSFFTLHDLSGDGKLNFEEFCLAMGYSPKIGAE